MTTPPTLHIFPDLDALQQAAAEQVAALATQQAAAAGAFTLILAGGSTPGGIYQRLAHEPLRSQINWQQGFVGWGDERYVPPDDPASNYLLARHSLLDHVPIPSDHVFPIPTETSTPQQAAQRYQHSVETLLAQSHRQFDIVLLGMGDDGHTASLFPHSAALVAPDTTLVAAIEDAPKPPPQRVSLTAAALNRAAHVIFCVAGTSKAAALRAVLRGPHNPHHFPAQLVHPPHGTVTWLVDNAAAQQLA